MGLHDPIVFRATWSLSCPNISADPAALRSPANTSGEKHGGKTGLLLLVSGLLKALGRATGISIPFSCNYQNVPGKVLDCVHGCHRGRVGPQMWP